jgi:hypothetical protein
MQFLKNNYEKVLLSVVLLGLAIAAAALPLQVAALGRFLDETKTRMVRTQPKPFEPIELTTNQMVINRLIAATTPQIASPEHNLFNPVTWKQTQDRRIYKASGLGPNAVSVDQIRPLHLQLTIEGGGSSSRNEIGVLLETDPRPRMRTRSLREGVKVNLAPSGKPPLNLELLAVRPNSSQVEYDLRLHDQEFITLTSEQPYMEIIAFAADLVYETPSTTLAFPDKRLGDELRLPDDPTERYIIIAMDADEVVLSADSTKKRTVISKKVTNLDARNLR